jgi:hypothetical protein
VTPAWPHPSKNARADIITRLRAHTGRQKAIFDTPSFLDNIGCLNSAQEHLAM